MRRYSVMGILSFVSLHQMQMLYFGKVRRNYELYFVELFVLFSAIVAVVVFAVPKALKKGLVDRYQRIVLRVDEADQYALSDTADILRVSRRTLYSKHKGTRFKKNSHVVLMQLFDFSFGLF